MLFSTPLLVAIAGFAVSVFAEPPPGFAYDENCEAETYLRERERCYRYTQGDRSGVSITVSQPNTVGIGYTPQYPGYVPRPAFPRPYGYQGGVPSSGIISAPTVLGSSWSES